MASSAEHKVRMFRIAANRKAAGLPVWEKSIKVKDILEWKDAIASGKEMSNRIVDQLAECMDSEAITFDDELADIEYSFRHVADIDDFNNILEQFYDWADEKRVWLGL